MYSDHWSIKSKISVIRTNPLMLYREIIVSFLRSKKHINTLCEQNIEFVSVKLVVHMVTTGL